MSPQGQLLQICERGHVAMPSHDPRAWDPCGESAAVVLLTLLAFFLITV
jgi:hypothetical protein